MKKLEKYRIYENGQRQGTYYRKPRPETIIYFQNLRKNLFWAGIVLEVVGKKIYLIPDGGSRAEIELPKKKK